MDGPEFTFDTETRNLKVRKRRHGTGRTGVWHQLNLPEGVLVPPGNLNHRPGSVVASVTRPAVNREEGELISCRARRHHPPGAAPSTETTTGRDKGSGLFRPPQVENVCRVGPLRYSETRSPKLGVLSFTFFDGEAALEQLVASSRGVSVETSSGTSRCEWNSNKAGAGASDARRRYEATYKKEDEDVLVFLLSALSFHFPTRLMRFERAERGVPGVSWLLCGARV